jgi:hypothetical protein
MSSALSRNDYVGICTHGRAWHSSEMPSPPGFRRYSPPLQGTVTIMNRKHLSSLALAISASACYGKTPTLPDAWDASHYGSCYTSIEEGMAAVYGATYELDENVRSERLDFGKNTLVMSSDRTTGTNSARTMFERRHGKVWCVVLTSPPVASIAPLMHQGRPVRPTKWETLTQAPPGFTALKVIYTWDTAKALYIPTGCFHISGTSAKGFDCREAYK